MSHLMIEGCHRPVDNMIQQQLMSQRAWMVNRQSRPPADTC